MTENLITVKIRRNRRGQNKNASKFTIYDIELQ